MAEKFDVSRRYASALSEMRRPEQRKRLLRAARAGRMVAAGLGLGILGALGGLARRQLKSKGRIG